jgi:hypothetical protein
MNRRRHRPEDQIQRSVIAHLRARGVPGLVWTHVPNGGKRSKVEGAILKGLGVRAGVSDVLLWHRGRAFALELKAEGGRPSEQQMQFISDLNAAGGFATIASGIDEAIRVLECWGLLRGTTA